MILRLTASCNNRCFFCIVDDEIAATSYRPTEELLAEIDGVPADERIDIFGGEPTIDPSFWPVLERALGTGRRVTVASNVRLFHHRAFAARLRGLGGERVVIRTTLMGPNAELHDRLNGARNAFAQTVRGIENLAAEGVEVRTNIVILEENIDAVTETALVAWVAGSETVKLSGAVRTHKFRGSVPDPARVREVVAQTVRVLTACGVAVRLEKLPLCVAGRHVALLQPEELTLLERNPYFRPTPHCSRCAMATGCPGGELGALERYGDAWMEPFDAAPDGATVKVHWRDIGTFEPPDHVHFVQLDRTNMLIEELFDVGVVVADFHKRHPGVTIL